MKKLFLLFVLTALIYGCDNSANEINQSIPLEKSSWPLGIIQIDTWGDPVSYIEVVPGFAQPFYNGDYWDIDNASYWRIQVKDVPMNFSGYKVNTFVELVWHGDFTYPGVSQSCEIRDSLSQGIAGVQHWIDRRDGNGFTKGTDQIFTDCYDKQIRIVIDELTTENFQEGTRWDIRIKFILTGGTIFGQLSGGGPVTSYGGNSAWPVTSYANPIYLRDWHPDDEDDW